MKKFNIYIGFDPREVDAFLVAKHTLKKHTNHPYPIKAITMQSAMELGYKREHTRVGGQLYDQISQAPMSTEFALTRFMLPFYQQGGWALFVDCDMMFLTDVHDLVKELDDKYAVQCVKHEYVPQKQIKMDGQIQTNYARKNWSSVMALNLDHPANKALTLDLINTMTGRDLHRFCWLDDSEIGDLSKKWNILHGEPWQDYSKPANIHFTNGLPSQTGDSGIYENMWRGYLNEAVCSV